MMEFQNDKRLHDSLYLKENHFQNPKESFKYASKIIDTIESNKKINLLDIGCAAGDFLKYLTFSKDLNKYELFGLDISEDLIKASKENVPQAKFLKCDFSLDSNKFEDLFGNKFDIITMFGVHSCFDNLDWIKNISYLLNKKGTAIIWGIFNPYPYDVLMRVKNSDSSEYQSGWNVHSIKSVKKESNLQNLKLEIINYQPDLIINRNNSDLLRSWTINLGDNQKSNFNKKNIDNELLIETEREKIYTNGTRIIHDWCFCKLTKI